MPDYEHDIFVSYRRSDEDWVRWTRDNFVHALTSLLRPGLGKVRIYIDEDIETGASWPAHLARNLSRSKLMVAVLSRDYFQSDWCCLEMTLMCRREKLVQFRTADNPSRLIIPMTIDDGDCFPPEIRAMQCEQLHQFANPFIRTDSPKQEDFTERLREKVCPMIEQALATVPDFDPAWEGIAHEGFENLFRISTQAQLKVPALVPPRLP